MCYVPYSLTVCCPSQQMIYMKKDILFDVRLLIRFVVHVYIYIYILLRNDYFSIGDCFKWVNMLCY